MASAGTTSGGATVYPETPSGHGEALGESVDDQRALVHAGIAQHGKIFAAVDDARVDFVGENPQVVFDGELGQGSLHVIGVDGSGRIAG